MASSPLTQRIVLDIRRKVQLGELPSGSHLSAQKVADAFEVSRSPAREALGILAEQGVLEQIPRRGYFVVEAAQVAVTSIDQVPAVQEPTAYYQLSEDWLNDTIAAEVTEKYVRNRYGLTKAQVNDILGKAAKVGWAEPKPGYGWRFLDVAKTPEALQQIYKVRALIEPAALLESSFQHDFQVLGRLKREQLAIQAGGVETLATDALLEAGFRFHEELVGLSGNPLYLMVLKQMNNMRRLLEYRAMPDRQRFRGQCAEHLQMLEWLEQGDNIAAANLMSQHLEHSLACKSPLIMRQDNACAGPATPLI